MIKAPFIIEYKRKIKGRYAIQFLKDTQGRFIGQFNTHNGYRTGTFTSFAPRPPKEGLCVLREGIWYPLIVSQDSGRFILEHVWNRLYESEPTCAAQTEALFTISALLTEIA